MDELSMSSSTVFVLKDSKNLQHVSALRYRNAGLLSFNTSGNLFTSNEIPLLRPKDVE